MRFALPALAALVLLAGCVPTTSGGPSLHDIVLYGALDARLSYVYGSPGTLTLDGRDVTLTQGSMGGVPYAVSAALLVDRRPYVRAGVPPLAEPPVVVSRIPQTTDLVVHTGADVLAAVYYDGSTFFDLTGPLGAGVDKRVVPRPRLNRLRGLGQLTDGEADAVADALVADGGPFALALLPADALPPHSVDGVSDQRTTGLYVQTTFATDAAAFRPAPQQIPWEVVAQGAQAVGADRQSFVLVTDEGQLANLWNRANGSQLQLPAIPDVDLSRETILFVFAGQQPSGGYGIDVRRVSVDGGELYVDAVFTRPAPGAITTQALTSPWVMIRVLRGGFDVAWFRNPDDGSLLGVARATP